MTTSIQQARAIIQNAEQQIAAIDVRMQEIRVSMAELQAELDELAQTKGQRLAKISDAKRAIDGMVRR